MPIIDPTTPTDPLTQGDLLQNIRLFCTSKIDTTEGGDVVVTRTNICLVLSRPCVIGHKPAIIVAAVDRLPAQTPSAIKTFEHARDFLTKMRDGEDSPDVFYLGQLPGKEADGRYAARFDSLHTIAVPQKPDLRANFLAKHRFARLQNDFVRDLHTRLFQSFATQGFDDHAWFSDADLRYLLDVGNAEIATFQVDKDRLAAASQADGGESSELKSLDKRIADTRKKMEPYQRELERRSTRHKST